MADPFGLHWAADTLVARVRGIASDILLGFRASAPSVVPGRHDGVVHVAKDRCARFARLRGLDRLENPARGILDTGTKIRGRRRPTLWLDFDRERGAAAP
jgi:hypothetical protein